MAGKNYIDEWIESLSALNTGDVGGSDNLLIIQNSESKRITAANLAAFVVASDAASSTYAPLVESFRIELDGFGVVAGSPTLSVIASRLKGWQFDAAADERVARLFTVPAHWNSYDVDYIVCNMTSDTGVVRFLCDTIEYADDDSFNQSPSSVTSDWTALGQYVMDTITVKTGVACTPAKTQLLRMGRAGNSGSDTKSGDVAVVAVQFRRAS